MTDRIASLEGFSEEYRLLNETQRKNFSRIVSKLLNENFLIKDKDSDRSDYADFSELCAEHYIVKNKSFAFVKYGLCFKLNNQIIDLDLLNADFAISDESIEKMEIITVNKLKVVTIENLTTYNYYNVHDAIIIYLGGYHNSTKRKLLQKIHDSCHKLEWYHIGDIDWGGFEILLHLRRKSGIDFKPLHMGIEELLKYNEECIQLTENDRKKLLLLRQNPEAEIFYAVIDFMLKNGYKLEQESIVF